MTLHGRWFTRWIEAMACGPSLVRDGALDGGGSSSIVARDGGVVRVLNAPTGGADVGPGEERFINTYWLVFSK